ncbi:DUF2975 domain-containing protein [Metabacillus iocasae]|uniref:DUF2975 domain-containing protein n=1 Tax=Priestia iocasae TaxID=2291674 RepID=A0ABS2QU39_9BACI|nr:DUF2975 domain-containing protein [Metabacillus iocasae]MBM7702959.1 hypothetical protein [Metabacillus iocasae]
MKQRNVLFLKGVVVLIGLTILIACAFWLPSFAQKAALLNPTYAYLRYPVLLGLYLTAIPFFLALYQALNLLTYIEKGDVFSERPIWALGRIKHCAFLIILLYVIGMVLLGALHALHPGIALIGILIIVTTAVVTVLSAILQELLRCAVEMKIENELTV